MKRTLFTALLAVAAVAAAASIAYAAIPSGNGVISACKTKDGAIKLIDKEAGHGCPGSQQLVEWNQQGPAGPGGPQGPPSGNAYFATLPTNTSLPEDFGTIESLSLPAGEYVVFAVGTLDDSSPGTDSECLIGSAEAGDTEGPLDYESVVATVTDTVERFSLIGPVSWPGGELHLRCRGTGADVWGGYLSAIAVGDLTQQ
jgi:hypothetical protein